MAGGAHAVGLGQQKGGLLAASVSVNHVGAPHAHTSSENKVPCGVQVASREGLGQR